MYVCSQVICVEKGPMGHMCSHAHMHAHSTHVMWQAQVENEH